MPAPAVRPSSLSPPAPLLLPAGADTAAPSESAGAPAQLSAQLAIQRCPILCLPEDPACPPRRLLRWLRLPASAEPRLPGLGQSHLPARHAAAAQRPWHYCLCQEPVYGHLQRSQGPSGFGSTHRGQVGLQRSQGSLTVCPPDSWRPPPTCPHSAGGPSRLQRWWRRPPSRCRGRF